MDLRSRRWVERGLLSPARRPRQGQRLFWGCVYETSVPARPCHSTGRCVCLCVCVCVCRGEEQYVSVVWNRTPLCLSLSPFLSPALPLSPSPVKQSAALCGIDLPSVSARSDEISCSWILLRGTPNTAGSYRVPGATAADISEWPIGPG